MGDVVVIEGGKPRRDLRELERLLAPPLRTGGAVRALVFGSRARGTADAWSDLDLLVVVRNSDKPFVERWTDFAAILDIEPATDLLVYTEQELQVMQAAQNPFVTQALAEGVEIDVR